MTKHISESDSSTPALLSVQPSLFTSYGPAISQLPLSPPVRDSRRS